MPRGLRTEFGKGYEVPLDRVGKRIRLSSSGAGTMVHVIITDEKDGILAAAPIERERFVDLYEEFMDNLIRRDHAQSAD